jgi:HEPN domain-containing protein
MSDQFNKSLLIEYWINSSEKDFKTMNDLFNTKNNHWALFMGHLVIEKLAKALYVKQMADYPPMLHDLRRILEKSGIEVNPDQRIILDTITRFNINARYDDYKNSFYKLCTDDFTKEWITKIKECRLWIKTML